MAQVGMKFGIRSSRAIVERTNPPDPTWLLFGLVATSATLWNVPDEPRKPITNHSDRVHVFSPRA